MTYKKNQYKNNKNPDKKDVNLKKETKKHKTKVEQLEHELKEKNERLLRSYADFQNYQKRAVKELKLKEEEIKKKYLSELIDLYDLLNKLHKDKYNKKTLKLILNNLERFFEEEKVKILDCSGEAFNHNMHHAVSIVERDDCENETIIDEISKGYFVEDKLFRPAKVIVANKKEDEKKR
jgi:molecular chaperone GrpE